MADQEERLGGLRRVLAAPQAYDLFQQISGGKRGRKYLVNNYVKGSSSRILDIGCGTGYILDYLNKDVNYKGYDLNQTYIDFAKKKYPQYDFHCERVNKMELNESEQFDYVIATGLLHHLNDQESSELIEIAYSGLKKGGKFLTLDGVYTDTQSKLSKWVLNNDRGKHVRTEAAYMTLANKYFDQIDSEVSDKIFIIPYTACILSCEKS